MQSKFEIFPLISWLSVLFLAQIAAQVPFGSAVFLTLIGVVILRSGRLIVLRMLPQLNPMGQYALGACVAMSAWTAADQILRTIDARFAALPLLALCSHLLAREPREARDTDRTQFGAINSWSTPLFTGLLATLLLAQTWSWLAAPAVCSLIFLLVASRSSSNLDAVSKVNITLRVTGALFVASVLAGSLIRSNDWWLPGYGLDETELLSNAAYQWGPRMDVFIAGESLNYQWLNFALLGLFEAASGSDDWIVTTRFEFVASGLLIAMLVWAFMIEFLKGSRISLRASILACLICTPTFYPNHFGLFAPNNRGFQAVFLISLALSIVAWAKHRYSWWGLFIVCAVAVSYVSTKTAAIVPLGTGLAVAEIWFLLTRRFKEAAQVCILGLTLVANLLLSVKGSSGIEIRPDKPFRVLSQYMGNQYETLTSDYGLRTIITSLLGVGLLLSLTALALATALRLKSNGDLLIAKIVLFAQLAIGVTFAVFGYRAAFTHMHFLQVSVVTLSLIAPVVALCDDHLSTVLETSLGKLLGFTTVGIALASNTAPFISDTWFNIPILNRLGWSRGVEEQLSLYGVIGAASVIVLSVIKVCLTISSAKRRQDLVVSLLAFLLIFSAVNGTFNWLTIGAKPTFDSGVAEGQLGDPDLQAIGRWFDSHTEVGDIVATNLLFSADSSSPPHCVTSVEEKNDVVNFALTQYFVISAVVVERRFVAAGVYYATLASGIDVTARVEASLTYACSPSVRSRKILKLHSAKWYLAYTPGALPNLLEGDSIELRVGDYTVIQLQSLADTTQDIDI